MVERAQAAGISIQYSEQVMVSDYDKDAGIIFLNPNRKLPDVVIALAGELRSVWQQETGAGVYPLAFDPDQAILINRLQIADRAVAMVRTGWELSLADYKSVWSRLENSSLEDVARSFAREAYLDFRTLNNGEAASAAFETWFMSERCREHDRSLIQTMLTESYTKKTLGQDGISNMTVLKLIGRLGEMPFGKNYLAQYAGLITQDPLFTNVRDRSNANFLWFIKFEQSFRGVEQELQSSPDHNSGSPESQGGGLSSQQSDKRERNAHSTDKQTLNRFDSNSQDAENVISLQFEREEGEIPENLEPKWAGGDGYGGSASIVIFPENT